MHVDNNLIRSLLLKYYFYLTSIKQSENVQLLTPRCKQGHDCLFQIKLATSQITDFGESSWLQKQRALFTGTQQIFNQRNCFRVFPSELLKKVWTIQPNFAKSIAFKTDQWASLLHSEWLSCTGLTLNVIAGTLYEFRISYDTNILIIVKTYCTYFN